MFHTLALDLGAKLDRLGDRVSQIATDVGDLRQKVIDQLLSKRQVSI